VIAVTAVSVVQEYVSRHSDVIVIDPLESIMKLFDRHQQYNLVKHCLAFSDITGAYLLCVKLLVISVLWAIMDQVGGNG